MADRRGWLLVVGLFISEVWFGWATQEELQPNIDGLSFDEVLLGLVPGIVTVLVIRHVTRRNRRRSTDVASKRSGTPGGRPSTGAV